MAGFVQSSDSTNVLIELANEYPQPGFAHPTIREAKGQASLIRLRLVPQICVIPL
ncbi:MAG: hypothetical protein O3C21_11790 [Verrucomicrobia bacterium]|nr:hypothetical protein [Verrucomicrobiota bacterium]